MDDGERKYKYGETMPDGRPYHCEKADSFGDYMMMAIIGALIILCALSIFFVAPHSFISGNS